MITKSLHPLSPNVEFSIDGVAVDYTAVQGMDLYLTENEHDMLSIDIVGLPPRAVTDYLGAGVYVLVDSGYGRSQSFYGYIISTEPQIVTRNGLVNRSPVQITRLNCIGASLNMKTVSSRVWDYPTLGNIIKEMAAKYHFSVDYPKDSFKPTRLVQSSESDWSFLRKVIDTFGYTMSVHGTHMHIWDRDKSVGRLTSYHDLLTMKTDSNNSPCSVMSFSPYLGHLSSLGNSSKTTNTILDREGNVFEMDATNTDIANHKTVLSSKFTIPLKTPYQTVEENIRAIASSERYKSVYRAKAEIAAGGGIVPGGTVNLNKYDSAFDGLWYVSSVHHKIGKEKYVTNLELFKNDDYTQDPEVPNVSNFIKPPTPIMKNGVWVSSLEKVNEYT
jgi:phage protein D